MAKKIKTATDDIRKLSDKDLAKQIDESYRRLFALRLQKEMLQLQNHRELPNIRRAIARLKTFERQRQLAKGSARSEAAPVTAAPGRKRRGGGE